VEFADGGIRKIIEAYTREAGLRNLEREIGAICRKVAVAVAKGKTRRYRITAATVEKMLGAVRHFSDEVLKRDQVGVATGLAWTSVGGDILFVEALAVRGKGGLRLTGQLGDVMKESAQAAMSYARAHGTDLGIPADFFETHDVHVHVPEGSIPKDGPSAGITMAAAMISAFTHRKVRRDVAMTGEITLRGEVLPIGGVKEKVLAARQAKFTTVILPKLNRRDVLARRSCTGSCSGTSRTSRKSWRLLSSPPSPSLSSRRPSAPRRRLHPRVATSRCSRESGPEREPGAGSPTGPLVQ
jgi:ATP-dependent Lon protease